jgi:DNA-binding CsgD family transcriptional regulator
MELRSNGRNSTQLNPGQVQCILLVGNHLTSKEIAKRLGISRHTVDQRIRGVLRATGTTSRRQAAQLIKLQCELEAKVDDIGLTNPEGTTVAEQTAPAASLPHFAFGLMPPFATRRVPSNRMGMIQRILWIVVIALGAFASTMMYVAGLESLARLIH